MSEAVVIGGGLAGGAAAALLAAQGRRVTLIERQAGPHDKVCGEFLSVEAQALLVKLGLDLDALGGERIDRLRLIMGSRTVEAALPFTALGLTRRRLDGALLVHAAGLGAKVQRGVAVRSVARRVVETAAGSIQSDTLLLASGKHEVRGLRRETAGAVSGQVGFKMYFNLSDRQREALAGHIELILFDGGYAGLQLVENGVANLCLTVTAERFEAAGRSWDGLFAALLDEPHLQRRFEGATPVLSRPLSIAGTPYGFLHRDRPHEISPVFRLGDQAAVIPSFCGDGMAIALHSARLAAAAVAQGADPGLYHARLRRGVGRQVAMATALHRLGEGSAGRGAVVTVASLAPRLLSLAASWSRIPARALAA